MGPISSKSTFASDLSHLSSRSKTSIYALCLAKIKNFSAKTKSDSQQVKTLTEVLKKMILNHSQSLPVLVFHLQQTIAIQGLSSQFKNLLKDMVIALKDTKFKNSFNIDKITREDLEARTSRQLESQLAIHLFQSPSTHMWESVNKISASIIDLINSNADNPELFSSFLEDINGREGNEMEPNIPLAFSHFSTPKKLRDVIEILKEGNDLGAVMLIHFMFMRNAFSRLDIPEKFYDSILANPHGGDFKNYLQSLKLPEDYREIVLFFTHYTSFSLDLYSDRGRAEFNMNLDNHLGIITNEQDRSLMPVVTSSWYPDCICQNANLNSNFVKSLTQHDIPYVAGPSGMTSLFSGALTLLGSQTTPQEKNYYLLAVLAFMVGGGLHSIHEVLSIPNTRLGLIPEYQTTGKDMGNFDAFFSLFSTDAEVTNLMEQSWSKTMSWLNSTYPAACAVHEISGREPPEDSPSFCCTM